MKHSTLTHDEYSHGWWKNADDVFSHIDIPLPISNLHDRFQRYLLYVGLVIGCHQRPDRSLCVLGRQVPVCARCLGMLIGPLFAPLYLWFPSPWIAAAVISAFLVDGFTQLTGCRESKNWMRFLTGAGFSASVVFLMIRGAKEWLLNIRL